MKQPPPKAILVLEILLFSCGMIGLLIIFFRWKPGPIYELEVQTGPVDRVGGTGGGTLPDHCLAVFYDTSGTIITDTATFSGDAPLYRLAPPNAVLVDPPPHLIRSDNIPPRNSIKQYHCFYPRHIPPAVLAKGMVHYPMILTADVDRRRIRQGESMRLIARAEILDSFEVPTEQSGQRDFIIALDDAGQAEVWFDVNTTTFDRSPDEEPNQIHRLQLFRPVSETWIISPKSDALSQQTIQIYLRDADDLRLADIQLDIEVRAISGIHPGFAALVQAVGGALLGIFAIFKLIPDVRAGVHELFSSNETEERTKRKSKSRKFHKPE